MAVSNIFTPGEPSHEYKSMDDNYLIKLILLRFQLYGKSAVKVEQKMFARLTWEKILENFTPLNLLVLQCASFNLGWIPLVFVTSVLALNHSIGQASLIPAHAPTMWTGNVITDRKLSAFFVLHFETKITNRKYFIITYINDMTHCWQNISAQIKNTVVYLLICQYNPHRK